MNLKIKKDLDIKEIIRLFVKERLGPKAIAAKFRVSSTTIIKKLNEKGIETKRRQKVDPKLIKKIIHSYLEEGLSPREIGPKYGVSGTTIQQYLINSGCRLKTFSEATRTHLVDESFLEKIDTEEKAYWLGFLYADGCVRNAHRQSYLALSLGEKDKRHVEAFKKAIKTQAPIFKRISKPREIKGVKVKSCISFGIHISSKKIVNDLINLGCVPRKSLILKFPTEEQVPKQLIHHFVRGYFDGDGTIYRYSRNGRKCYKVKILSSYMFLDSLQKLLSQELQFRKSRVYKETKDGKIYAMGYGGNHQIFKIHQWMYKDAITLLQRKKDIFLEMKKQGLKDVSKTENYWRAKEWEFWDENGKYRKIRNLRNFCRENPKYNATGLQDLANGKERQYKGWTKFIKGKTWKRVVLLIPPTTGKNYDYKALLPK